MKILSIALTLTAILYANPTQANTVTEADILCDKLVLSKATLVNDRVSKIDIKKYNQCLISNKKLNTVIDKHNFYSINAKYNKLK